VGCGGLRPLCSTTAPRDGDHWLAAQTTENRKS
jgi:hypothetical protein